MRVQVQKWGNSLALRIPKPIAEGSEGRLVAAPVTSRRIRLNDLLRRVTKRNLHGETHTGGRLGREAW